MSEVRRFPRKRSAPRPQPMCGQCGREMSGLFPRQSDYLAHELQSGVRLNLRVFAEASDPHECGPVKLEITAEEIIVGWYGAEDYRLEWGDLLAILRNHTMPDPDIQARGERE